MLHGSKIWLWQANTTLAELLWVEKWHDNSTKQLWHAKKNVKSWSHYSTNSSACDIYTNPCLTWSCFNSNVLNAQFYGFQTGPWWDAINNLKGVRFNRSRQSKRQPQFLMPLLLRVHSWRKLRNWIQMVESVWMNLNWHPERIFL